MKFLPDRDVRGGGGERRVSFVAACDEKNQMLHENFYEKKNIYISVHQDNKLTKFQHIDNVSRNLYEKIFCQIL